MNVKFFKTVLYDRELLVRQDEETWTTIWISDDLKSFSVTKEQSQEVTNSEPIMRSFWKQQLDFCYNMA